MNPKEMVKEEVTLCEDFLKKQGPLKTTPRMPLKTFVERGFLMHQHLIERWDGWEFRGPISKVEDATAAYGLAQTEWSKANERIGVITKKFRNDEDTDPLLRWWDATCGVWNQQNGGWVTSSSHLLSQKTIERKSMNGYDYQMEFDAKHKLYVVAGFYTRPDGSIVKASTPLRIGAKTSTLILKALDEMDVAGRAPAIYAEYERLLQRCGEAVWGAQTVDSAVTLTVRPSAFLRLAHYPNVDSGSCYGNQGLHSSSKLFLAIDIPDSMVLWTFRGPETKQKQEAGTPMGRGWSIACPQHGAVVSNFYHLTKDNIYPALLEALRHGLGINEELDAFGAKLISIRDHNNSAFYTNGDCTYLAKRSEASQKLVSKYLEAVLDYSDKKGLYTRNGAGPADVKKDLPSCWPYPDVPMTPKSAGIFL